VTLARQGFIDHTDSLGAAARFGHGDVQWMTAGRGVVHSEMFPLVNTDRPNPTELFQIWLNLPAESKMVPAHFTMLWSEQVPRRTDTDDQGAETHLTVVAGPIDGLTPGAPPPDSWAARDDTHVAIWTLQMDPGARWTLPAGDASPHRVLYFFEGRTLTIDGQTIEVGRGIQVVPDVDLELVNGASPSE